MKIIFYISSAEGDKEIIGQYYGVVGLPSQSDVIVLDGVTYQVINRWFYISDSALQQVHVRLTKF